MDCHMNAKRSHSESVSLDEPTVNKKICNSEVICEKGSHDIVSMCECNDEQWNAFLEWAISVKGCKANKLRCGNSENTIGRGMFAVERVTSKDRIVEIPLSIVITEETAWEVVNNLFPGFSCIEQVRQSFGDGLVLFAFMILQRLDKDAEFHLYFKSCPTSLFEQRFPLWWGEEEADKLLYGTPLLQTLRKKKELLTNQHAKFTDHLNKWFENNSEQYSCSKWKLEWFSLRNFLWAYSVFFSRAFPAKLAQSTGMGCLLPFADILNHKYAIPISWDMCRPDSSCLKSSLSNESSIVFIAEDGYVAEIGEEVFNNYGAKSNGELFIGYGFALMRNPSESIQIAPIFAPKISKSLVNEDLSSNEKLLVIRDPMISNIPDSLIRDVRNLVTSVHSTDDDLNSVTDPDMYDLSVESEILSILRIFFWGKILSLFHSSNSQEIRSRLVAMEMNLESCDFINSKNPNEINALIYRVGQCQLLFKVYDSLESQIFPQKEIRHVFSIALPNIWSISSILAEYPDILPMANILSERCGGEISLFILHFMILTRNGEKKYQDMVDESIGEITQEQVDDYVQIFEALKNSLGSYTEENSKAECFLQSLNSLSIEEFIYIAYSCECRCVQLYLPRRENSSTTSGILNAQLCLIPVVKFPRRPEASDEVGNCFFSIDYEEETVNLKSIGSFGDIYDLILA